LELQQSHVDRTVAVEDTLLEGLPICWKACYFMDNGTSSVDLC
jgi:hypothetical protein